MGLTTIAVPSKVDAYRLHSCFVKRLDPAKVGEVVLEAHGGAMEQQDRVSRSMDLVVKLKIVIANDRHSGVRDG